MVAMSILNMIFASSFFSHWAKHRSHLVAVASFQEFHNFQFIFGLISSIHSIAVVLLGHSDYSYHSSKCFDDCHGCRTMLTSKRPELSGPHSICRNGLAHREPKRPLWKDAGTDDAAVEFQDLLTLHSGGSQCIMDLKVSAHKGLDVQHAAACQAFGTPKTSQKLINFEGLHLVWTGDVSNEHSLQLFEKNKKKSPKISRGSTLHRQISVVARRPIFRWFIGRVYFSACVKSQVQLFKRCPDQHGSCCAFPQVGTQGTQPTIPDRQCYNRSPFKETSITHWFQLSTR